MQSGFNDFTFNSWKTNSISDYSSISKLSRKLKAYQLKYFPIRDIVESTHPGLTSFPLLMILLETLLLILTPQAIDLTILVENRVQMPFYAVIITISPLCCGYSLVPYFKKEKSFKHQEPYTYEWEKKPTMEKMLQLD